MSETEKPLDNAGGAGESATGAGRRIPEADVPLGSSEREAYFRSLSLWIQQAQMYQNLSQCFPYYFMSFQGLQASPPSIPLLNNNYQFQGHPWQFPLHNNVPRFPPDARPQETLTPADVIARNGGYEYVIPPLYKRLFAEFIDFVLLFVLKLIVTFIAVDMFEIIDIEKFDLYKLGENFDDYKLAIEVTSEILCLEMMYRIVVCVFEAACLCGGVGRIGGATPGKALLGLRVVTASAIISVEGRTKETVLLYPGTPLNLSVAVTRSLLKNLLISLLFPLCFILFVFRFNRTFYDLACGVVVVEENMFPPRRHAP